MKISQKIYNRPKIKVTKFQLHISSIPEVTAKIS